MTPKPPTGATPPKRSLIPIVVPLLVVLLTAVLLGWSGRAVLRPARGVEVAQAIFDRSAEHTTGVDLAEESESRTGPTVQAAGWLEAEPFYIAATALADGVVESIEVLEGEYVEQGTVVARLIAEDSEIRLRTAQARLASASADLSIAAAELEAAEQNWEEPVGLDLALESAIAARSEAEAELQRLPSLIRASAAALERLDQELERAMTSQEGGAATDLEVIVARQRAIEQRENLAALREREPVLRARLDRASAEVRAAERDLALRIEDRRRLDATKARKAFAEARLIEAEARRDEAALELSRMTIRAPISGYVQQRFKIPGDKAIRMMDDPESSHIVHMYDPARLQVRVDVPLADASHIYAGQVCEVVVEVLPETVFKGNVLRTTHEADLQKNTLEVKVQVIEPSPILRPEMLTRVKFLPESNGTGTSRSATQASAQVRVPASAIDDSGSTPRVWVVSDRRGDRGRLRPVVVEHMGTEAGWAKVRGSISAGDLVATDFANATEDEPVRIVAESRGDPS